MKFSNERGLLQESHEGTAGGTVELLGVDRAVIVRVGSLEALLHEREKFIFVQSSVIVRVGRGKILGVDPAAQFAFVEGAVMIAIEFVKAALFASARSTVPSLSGSSLFSRLCDHAGAVAISMIASVANMLFPRMLMFVSSDSREIT